jgi:stress-induced morphogen
MMAPDEIQRLLLQAFPDGEVRVADMTGTQDHYEASVVSEAFVGKSLLEQHQLVYAALGAAMHGPIHALALKTYTPDAWAKTKG